jgi:hypothetical protein
MNTAATLKFDQLQRIARLFPLGESLGMSEAIKVLYGAQIFDVNLCIADLAQAGFIANPGGPRGSVKRLPDPQRPKDSSLPSPYWQAGDPTPPITFTICTGPCSGETVPVSEVHDLLARSRQQQETARVARLRTDLAAVGLLP